MNGGAFLLTPGWQGSGILTGKLQKSATAMQRVVAFASTQIEDEEITRLAKSEPYVLKRANHLISLYFSVDESTRSWLDLLSLLIANDRSLKYLSVGCRYGKDILLVTSPANLKSTLLQFAEDHNFPRLEWPIITSVERLIISEGVALLKILNPLLECVLVPKLRYISFNRCDGATTTLDRVNRLGIRLSELCLIDSGSTGDIESCLLSLPPTLKTLHLKIKGDQSYPSSKAIERHSPTLKRLWMEVWPEENEFLLLHCSPNREASGQVDIHTVMTGLPKLEEVGVPLELSTYYTKDEMPPVSFHVPRLLTQSAGH